jgi:hypothetical protein
LFFFYLTRECGLRSLTHQAFFQNAAGSPVRSHSRKSAGRKSPFASLLVRRTSLRKNRRLEDFALLTHNPLHFISKDKLNIWLVLFLFLLSKADEGR